MEVPESMQITGDDHMKPSNIDELRRSFTVQAAGFESGTYHLSKKEYLDYLVLRTGPQQTDHVLEVAA